MKLRIGLTLWIYFCSLIALLAGANHLDLALGLYAPLEATHLGPRAPVVTQMIIEAAPRYPLWLALAAAAPVAAAAFHPSLAPVGVLLAVLGYALGTYGGWLTGLLMYAVSGDPSPIMLP